MARIIVLSAGLLIFPLLPAFAQPELHTTKEFFISKTDSSLFLDYWIIENTLQAELPGFNKVIEPDGNWQFNAAAGTWKILSHNWIPEEDSTLVRFTYRRYPFTLRPVYFNREIVPFIPAEDDTLRVDAAMVLRQRVTRDDLFGSADLQRSGSLTRGITVGSNQDMSLQSGLRFELSGYITDDVEVLATLTDQSTPIQPDGTTQNIRELDKVYIRLRNQHGTLQLGDIDVSHRSSEFAQVERRLQGVDIEADIGDYGFYRASASVVRGRFRVQEFSGRNGVQGPYRLSGADGEQFIIVLAGTERVYINGIRMHRGEENDYIIDYSLGEIQFTTNRLITDVSRITVDFQYVTREYNRTLLTAEGENSELLGGRLSVGAAFIRESDSRDLNTEFGLSEEEIEVLRQAGNDPDKATISGAENVGFREDADFILYAKVDTTAAGQTYEIFKNIPGDPSGVWRVRFSRVGTGNGSYRRKSTTVNGIVYEWVGSGAGEYEPFRRLPAPQNQQMAAVRSRFNMTENLEIYGEWAASDFDRNRFSDIDNEQNTDFGYLAGARMRPVHTVLGNIDFDIRHRYTGDNFAYFDRTREVEFERQWNITQVEQIRERITEGEFGLAFTEFSSVRLNSGFLSRTDTESYRHRLRLRSMEPLLPEAAYQAEYLESRIFQNETESRWFRQFGETRYSIPVYGINVTPSFNIETEDRRQRRSGLDSLQAGSFQFYDLAPGLDFRLGNTFQAGTRISYRSDRRASGGVMLNEAEAWTREFSTTVTPTDAFRTKNSFVIRDKTFSEYFVQNQQAENSRSVLVRSETDYRSGNDFFEMSLFYEGGTESRPLLQETYIEVGPEIGNYVWIDQNEDGVQQIDEFFPAQTPNEGTFILQFVPSDELFPVVSVNSRLRTHIRPAELLGESTGVLPAVLSNLELNSVLEIREQNRSGNIADILLFNLNRYQDEENTIDGRVYWQQDLRLFRPLRNLDARFSVDRSTGIRRRASGLDELTNQNIRAEGSYRFLRRWVAAVEFKTGKNSVDSEHLGSRSFKIKSIGIKPSLRYDHTRSLQTTAGFSLNRREDTLPQVPAVVNSYTVFSDMGWFYRNIIQTFARIEFRSNNLQGVSSSFGAFELTDGAGQGNTWMWSLQGTYRISEFLRATVNYDGRTVTGRPSIQTFRFTMNAVF